MSDLKNDIFISFSFKDFDLVNKIAETLSQKYGLKVWMCSKELHGGDQYYKIIPKEIRNSKIFLFVYSKNSLESKEIPSEILIARHSEKVIIPFLTDFSDLEDTDVEYFLITLNYVDGTRPTLENRIDDLSQSIYSSLSKFSDTSHLRIKFREKLLPSKPVFPVKRFVGRKTVSNEIEKYFSDGFHTIFLHGIGGIGKTEVAKKYAFDHRNDYDTIIYATYDGSVQSLINNDSIFMTDPILIRQIKGDGQLETDNEFFERKLGKIKSLSTERTLIIIDNFDVEYSSEFEKLFNGPYRLLITTRVDYSKTKYPQIDINPLENIDDLTELFFNNYDCDLVTKDDPKLPELFRLVNNHTYTIELIAKHMSNSLQSVEEMIERLSKEGLFSISESVYDEEMNTSIAYQNLFKLYQISSLSETDIDALRFLLFAPVEGIPSIYVKMWGGDEIFKSVRDLEKRSWVIKGALGYALHPIVHQIAKNNIEVSFDKCVPFLKRYHSYITHENPWRFKKVEKDIYASFAYKFLEFFPKICGENEELYYDIEMLLSFSVNAKKSLELANQLFDYYKEKNGENDYFTARSAYKIGWDHIFNRELPNSLENAKKLVLYSFELFQKVNRKLDSYETYSFYNMCRHVTKVYQFLYDEFHREEDFEKAVYYAKWSLDKIANEEDLEVKADRLACLNIQAADVYLVHHDYEEALKYVLEAERTATPTDSDGLYRQSRKAKCYAGLGRFEEGLELANKCLQGYIEKDGKYHGNIIETYSILKSCYEGLGDINKANECEAEISAIRKVLYA